MPTFLLLAEFSRFLGVILHLTRDSWNPTFEEHQK